MNVRCVALVANLDKPNSVPFLEEISRELKGRAIQVLVVPYHAQGVFSKELEQSQFKPDLAIVLGGDGTVLYCCRLFARQPIPILGINLGTVGFMAEVLRTEWQAVFNKFLSEELGVSERLMLSVEVLRDGKCVVSETALNDCVVSGSGSSRMIYVDVDLSGVQLGQYRADGIIVATPTGSTAYSLSAGGPILHPETDAMILTPICPHSLSNRPLVLPGSEKVVLTLKQKQRIPVTLNVDGRGIFQPEEGDVIQITRHLQKALLVKSDKRSFYEIVHAKLN